MAVYSHDTERPPLPAIIARPPGLESRSCEGRMWVEGHVNGARWISCSNSAVWTIPEASFCAHHLPIEWIELAQQRRALWVEYATELWQDIVAITERTDHG